MNIRYLILFILIACGNIAIAQQSNIITLEYFFDTDPGYGNGTLVTI